MERKPGPSALAVVITGVSTFNPARVQQEQCDHVPAGYSQGSAHEGHGELNGGFVFPGLLASE